ncbi:hypothetical protein FACS1894110_02030 [Spirochaetia bacterium]|nr:hypothetical protein FACS1894110_02030 [Spirochaetia bacterium]
MFPRPQNALWRNGRKQCITGHWGTILTAYNEAHLFDSGSDFNYRVFNDPHCEDKSHEEHWLVISFYQDHVIKPENELL